VIHSLYPHTVDMSNDQSPEDFFINLQDGLSNEHPALPSDLDSDENNEVDPDSFDDLPKSIIVTNIHSEVFTNEKLKAKMEDLFRQFSDSAKFCWLKSFRRLRVDFTTAVAAANGKVKQ
jgi:calcipressin-2